MILKTLIDRDKFDNKCFAYLKKIGFFTDDFDPFATLSEFHPDHVFELFIEIDKISKVFVLASYFYLYKVSPLGVTIAPAGGKSYLDEIFIPMNQVVTMYIKKYENKLYVTIPSEAVKVKIKK